MPDPRTGALRRVVALLVPLVLLGPAALVGLEIPFLAGRVNDQADLLGPGAESRIESVSATLERDTGAQVVVLTIPSLEEENLEDFSIRVVEAWSLGREGVDDGVLLLVSRDDRKLRLEVGYGLEGALPDVTARRIVDEVIVPEFRRGDFEGGIEAGVRAVDGVVRGEELPPPPKRGNGGGGAGPDVLGWLFMAVFIGGGALRSAIGRKPVRALIVGLVGGLLIGMGVGTAVSVLMGLVAVGVWIFFILLFFALPVPTGRGGRRGGWMSGGGWSGGGGGFSGGGFSGGGGSFGGGGASGSW